MCCGGVFPSPGGCLRASVRDGANVRCRSEGAGNCTIQIRTFGYGIGALRQLNALSMV